MNCTTIGSKVVHHSLPCVSHLCVGLETARSLALHGAHVILACRDMKKANNAVNEIRTERPMASVEAIHLDLACLRSIEQFVQSYSSKDW